MRNIGFGLGVKVDCPNFGKVTWDEYFREMREIGMNYVAFEELFYSLYEGVTEYVDRDGFIVLYIPNNYLGRSKNRLFTDAKRASERSVMKRCDTCGK